MTKFCFLLGGLLLIAILQTGCTEEVSPGKPAYIYVENLFFESDTLLGQGSSSSAITDVWISVDGQQLGANNLPALFPVILNENFATNSVKISAGIKNNGITNTRAIYPFYEEHITNLVLQPGKTDTFRPQIGYNSTANIVVVEDFENPNQAVFTDDLDGNPNTEMIHQTNEVFEGSYSGLMTLDSANLDCTVASSTHYYDVSKNYGSHVYLELNYKTNTPFQVGIVAHYGGTDTETIYKGGGNPTDTWKKIYFKLTGEIFTTNAPEYSVVFRALKYPDTDQPLIYVDNVKLLYF